MPKSKQKLLNMGGGSSSFTKYCDEETKIFTSNVQCDTWLRIHKKRCETCREGDKHQVPYILPPVVIHNQGILDSLITYNNVFNKT
jgi:hypothetical protein